MTYTARQKIYVWLNAIVGLTVTKIEALRGIMELEDMLATGAYMGVEARRLITPEQEQLIKMGMNTPETQAMFQHMADKEIGVVLKDDDNYPNKFFGVKNTPPLLYYKGNYNLTQEQHTIGVVGSRQMSNYGKKATKDLCEILARSGIVIISGMADGVDGIAHKSALDVGGKTIAVLGCGIDVVYPLKHSWLYDQIAENGLILSEHHVGVRPNNYHFPKRNRIISALSDAVLVTEAGKKSGALITANYAVEQGKMLFVVPTNIDNALGAGSNSLLKTLQASMVLQAGDILEEMQIEEFKEEATDMQLDFTEELVMDAIGFGIEVHMDELFNIMKLRMGDLSGLLSAMEIRGLITKYDNNHYGV